MIAVKELKFLLVGEGRFLPNSAQGTRPTGPQCSVLEAGTAVLGSPVSHQVVSDIGSNSIMKERPHTNLIILTFAHKLRGKRQSLVPHYLPPKMNMTKAKAAL